MGFTRGDEDQADKYGFMFYTHAGWDPKKFDAFFSDMIAKGYDTTPQWLSDHPTLANRVKATERRVSELPASIPTGAGPTSLTPSSLPNTRPARVRCQAHTQ